MWRFESSPGNQRLIAGSRPHPFRTHTLCLYGHRFFIDEHQDMRTAVKDIPISIFAGRSNPELAKAIASDYELDLGRVTIKNFADVEIYVRYEECIHGWHLIIIQRLHPCAV